jgi:hypothetical protein
LNRYLPGEDELEMTLGIGCTDGQTGLPCFTLTLADHRVTMDL